MGNKIFVQAAQKLLNHNFDTSCMFIHSKTESLTEFLKRGIKIKFLSSKIGESKQFGSKKKAAFNSKS